MIDVPGWYWHRLAAMSPGEVGGHAQKKLELLLAGRGNRDWRAVPLERATGFPVLPSPEQAPLGLRQALARDSRDIRAGRWRVFTGLELDVDDPPRWHCDYLARRDVPSTTPAVRLNHRRLPGGTDIRLIWELSRWHQLVRLAQAAYVLGDAQAAATCRRWLADWVTVNRPYRGWNWTSALEAGLRLIQFAWLDALLGPSTAASELEPLRYAILPAHAWFAWRQRSTGSSAGNHLLGELSGLLVATVRWPALARWGAPLARVQWRWEREILAQFAEDGGNNEQALHYHLFAWQSCWQALAALTQADRAVDPQVHERLSRAATFFVRVQAPAETWDYGDSDSSMVTPLEMDATAAVQEWRRWLASPAEGMAIEYWLGEARRVVEQQRRERPPATRDGGQARAELQVGHDGDGHAAWTIHPQSGQAVCRSGPWRVRWDLSRLGFLRPAAHGHLDALHVSIWYGDHALVIDPGTGSYFAHPDLRAWLASRAAHNGPCLGDATLATRRGPFLWSRPHAAPTWTRHGRQLVATLEGRHGRIRRSVERLGHDAGWRIEDAYGTTAGNAGEFTVRWQFAPESHACRDGERRFAVTRAGVELVVTVEGDWAAVQLVDQPGALDAAAVPRHHEPLAGVVSPFFRKLQWAPFLTLTARAGDPSRAFVTTFAVAPVR